MSLAFNTQNENLVSTEVKILTVEKKLSKFSKKD